MHSEAPTNALGTYIVNPSTKKNICEDTTHVAFVHNPFFPHFDNWTIFVISILFLSKQLLKTKVHQRRDRCRLGVRIRANPQNTSALKDLVVLIIVPLGWDGNNVTMSRRGGIWNDLKRSLLWNIRTVDPGETIDIQAQFKTTNPERGASEESQKFPVMARCKGDANFSKITLDTDFREDGSHPVGIDLERSTTILYRKI